MAYLPSMLYADSNLNLVPSRVAVASRRFGPRGKTRSVPYSMDLEFGQKKGCLTCILSDCQVTVIRASYRSFSPVVLATC